MTIAKAISYKDFVMAAILDTIAISLILFIPAISHLVAYPLHAFEPMRIILFGVILLMPHKKWNAITLAALLPIVSFLVSGHPLFPKNIVMSGELVLNVALLFLFVNITGKYSVSVLLSMLASKVVYYISKFLLIYYGALHVEMFSTSIYFQMIVIAVFSLAFLQYDKKKTKA